MSIISPVLSVKTLSGVRSYGNKDRDNIIELYYLCSFYLKPKPKGLGSRLEYWPNQLPPPEKTLNATQTSFGQITIS